MARVRYLLAALVGASLTASCGIQFKPAEHPKNSQLKSDVGNGGGATSGSRSGGAY